MSQPIRSRSSGSKPGIRTWEPEGLDSGLNQGLKQVQDFLRGLSLQQKVMLAGGAAAVALTLWGFVVLFGQGKNVTLYSGLRPADAQSLASRLAAKNIPYEISPDGASVLVPSDKVDAARLETAAQGLPRNARLGFELFDTPNWAGSDFSEKVNYQRALEGELERTLQTLNEVEAVRVHLVLPRESLFTEQEHESKAAVIVKTRGGTLSKEAQQAIPQLVASAVDGLRPENVTVVDADTATPFLSRRGPSGRASFDSDEELAAAAVHAIEPVVGAEHVRASVHVNYDLSTSEDTSETFDPKASAPLSAAAFRRAGRRYKPGGRAGNGVERSGRGGREPHGDGGTRQPVLEIGCVNLCGQQEHPAGVAAGRPRAQDHGGRAYRRRGRNHDGQRRQGNYDTPQAYRG